MTGDGFGWLREKKGHYKPGPKGLRSGNLAKVLSVTNLTTGQLFH